MSYMLIVSVVVQAALAASPVPLELDDATEWINAKLEGKSRPTGSRAAVEVHANHDPVQMNSRAGKPLNIAGIEFDSGLYCHAPSRLRVRLPKAGKTFQAIVGVDSNDQTRGGRGSVMFSVTTEEKTIWTSGTLNEGDMGVPVSIDLHGATEFWLEVSDTGDGISCDQADWANAIVTVDDGSAISVSDLPLEQSARMPLTNDPPFSFMYGGRPSSDFLASWPCERKTQPIDQHRNRHTIQYRDPDSRLEVLCEAIQYLDYPVVEWTMHFRNDGNTDTPVLSDIQPINSIFDNGSNNDVTLFHNKGDNCTADSFEPLVEPLEVGENYRIANTGGRPTQVAFPYFNLNFGDRGMIVVVSWAGQWYTQFTRDQGSGIRIQAGQEATHFKLHPGEQVRTPMIVVQFYRGNRWHGQNVWRSWMIEHNLPKPNGALPKLGQLAACSSHQFGEMIHATTDNQMFFIQKYLDRGFALDYWWMDAGWYWNKSGWPNTGTWEVDTNRFPGGLRPISDYAHNRGVDIIVWFEPERVTEGTWLADNHPEWIHGGTKGGLLNLGIPDARMWLTDHVDSLISSQGIDLYRQDFNMDPLSYWRSNDEDDRQGLTEIRHVEAYFAYWDALRKRHPGMLIDSCASGGRRNDLETLRRAVPLLRSDYIMEPTGNQCHTYALAAWFPYFGTGSSKTDPYQIMSTLCPHFTACWDQRDETIDWNRIRQTMSDWAELAPNYFGDFYPITDYSLKNDQWIAWQFHREEAGQGMVQAFRRDNCPYVSARLPLRSLDSGSEYDVHCLGHPEANTTLTGKKLMEEGIPILIDSKPGAVFVSYVKRLTAPHEK
ncbi:MAG: hypothetical protein AMXMBFR84_25210 [Candidatus Hydrogenedentota bacterium]